MNRSRPLLCTALTLFVTAAVVDGCSSSGLSVPAPVGSPAATDEPFVESPACAAVRANCVGEQAVTVRAHAENLRDVEGSAAQFAVRYAAPAQDGLDGPHGVALGSTRVRGGSFELCVCVPAGANWYPAISGVVFQPYSVGHGPTDVARAFYSQLYAVSREQDLTHPLSESPSLAVATASLAALEDRVATLAIVNGGALMPSGPVIGGIISDERPIAARPVRARVAQNNLVFQWNMPGRVLSHERVALLIDHNHNGRCEPSDSGAFVSPQMRESIDASTIELVTGDALTPICDALQISVSRE